MDSYSCSLLCLDCFIQYISLCANSSFHFYRFVVFHCMIYHYVSIYLLLDHWVVSSFRVLWWRCYKHSHAQVFSFFPLSLISFEWFSRSGVVESYGKFMFNFIRNLKNVFQMLYHFTFCGSSSCSISLPTVGVIHLFNFSHSNWHVIVFYCGLIFYFPNN